MAELMIPTGAATAHFAPSFSDLQVAIEAIDRAIKDEDGLPEGYAVMEPAHDASAADAETSATGASNVVDVDFDPPSPGHPPGRRRFLSGAAPRGETAWKTDLSTLQPGIAPGVALMVEQTRRLVVCWNTIVLSA